MKKRLLLSETIFVSSMLFGLFFGAGNLIFPVLMGQEAGMNVWPASIGFLITGVGLPLLAVAALGMTRCDGLFELAGRVGKVYSLFFTCALYLTIGPFFAIPRCATVSFTIGVSPILGGESALWLFIFSVLFFAAVLWFSLHPSGILTWVGKILNPLFLVFLAILMIRSFVSPMGSASGIEPMGGYIASALSTGFFEGYNTMDALAGLAFGIIVVTVIKNLGVEEGAPVAANTIISGFFSCLLMGVIYVLMALLGAQSRNIMEACGNGGEALAKIAEYYFGRYGAFLLAIMVTVACLKTAVGLVTSCSETFVGMFKGALSPKAWTYIFTGISFVLANLGLNQIIEFSIPVLVFLYPLAMVLILLALSEKIFAGSSLVYKVTVYCTLPVAICDFINALPFESILVGPAQTVINTLPFGNMGFGWCIPAFAGFVVSFVIAKCRKA